MNQVIMNSAGFSKEVNLVNENKCPFCKETVNLLDFKNKLSAKEYKISGLCQKCQDETFGV